MDSQILSIIYLSDLSAYLSIHLLTFLKEKENKLARQKKKTAIKQKEGVSWEEYGGMSNRDINGLHPLVNI